MKFNKMQGCGNDYIVIDGIRNHVNVDFFTRHASELCDKSIGIGADGILIIEPYSGTNAQMTVINPDGSKAGMCGNGVRMATVFLWENHYADSSNMRIRVDRRTVESHILTREECSMCHLEGTYPPMTQIGKHYLVEVNMGSPSLSPHSIPVRAERNIVINEPMQIDGEKVRVTCISMGNPHAVIFLEENEEPRVEKVGRAIENHIRFPERTNVEFVRVINRNEIMVRVWERGVGETKSCGSGSAAAVIASILNGLTDANVTVKLLGGKMMVTYNRKRNTIFLTSDAVSIYEGNLFEESD